MVKASLAPAAVLAPPSASFSQFSTLRRSPSPTALAAATAIRVCGERKTMKTNTKRSLNELIFDYGNVLFMLGLVVATLYPLLYIVFASFSDPRFLPDHRGLLSVPLCFIPLSF